MLSKDDLEAFEYYKTEEKLTPMGMVKDYYKTASMQPDPSLCAKLMKEEYEELRLAATLEEGAKELADLVFVLYGAALSVGIDLDEALYRVYENNKARMFWDDGKIHRNEFGKIIKNPNTPKVNLEGTY